MTETEKVPCLNKVEGKNPLPQLISGLDTSALIHTHIPKAGRGKKGGGRKGWKENSNNNKKEKIL